MKYSLLLLVLCVGCVHRAEPHFAERKCASGTVEVQYPHQRWVNGKWDYSEIEDKCQVVSYIINPKDGRKLMVLMTNVPLAEKGQDPRNTDGDDGADDDGPRKPRKLLRKIITLGISAGAAKLADDSVDVALGPNKARYVGAGVFVATYAIIHHHHKAGK